MRFALAMIAAVATVATPDADAVLSLPGYGKPPSPQFSGFLNASAAEPGTMLHYWFAAADSPDWKSMPVVLWLNGGPGASSLIGMLQEQGPLIIDRAGGLVENPWAWTKLANLVALESPAGVGYSYCEAMKRGGACANTDITTAKAAHAALLDLLSVKFPELRANAFFITGESYAGVYSPTLAAEIVALGADVIVLDDGFQHRRLARDLDIVLIDSTRPWGLAAVEGAVDPVEALLPRGLLREPVKSLARADAVVLTRCDQADPAALDAVLRRVQSCAPDVPVAHASHSPIRVRAPHGEEDPAWLKGRPVCLVSGVGNPGAFETTVRGLGAEVRDVHVFADHHNYKREELTGLCESGVELLVTAKDAVKLRELGVACCSLEVELQITEGAAPLRSLIEAKLCGGSDV